VLEQLMLHLAHLHATPSGHPLEVRQTMMGAGKTRFCGELSIAANSRGNRKVRTKVNHSARHAVNKKLTTDELLSRL
jgi:hypothetical protein